MKHVIECIKWLFFGICLLLCASVMMILEAKLYKYLGEL